MVGVMHLVPRNAFWVSFSAASGNLLFGWDCGALAGALLYVVPYFGLEDKPQLTGALLSSALLSAFLSTGVAGLLCDRWGRQRLLVVAGAAYSCSALLSAIAPSVYVLIAARTLNGVSNGFINTCMPIFIAEATERGRLATLPQLLSAVGVLASYSVAFLLSLSPAASWRFMLGSAFIPGSAFLLLSFLLPESPRWLASKGRLKQARQVYQQLRGQEDVTAELSALLEGLDMHTSPALEEWLLKPERQVSVTGARADNAPLHEKAHATAWLRSASFRASRKMRHYKQPTQLILPSTNLDVETPLVGSQNIPILPIFEKTRVFSHVRTVLLSSASPRKAAIKDGQLSPSASRLCSFKWPGIPASPPAYEQPVRGEVPAEAEEIVERPAQSGEGVCAAGWGEEQDVESMTLECEDTGERVKLLEKVEPFGAPVALGCKGSGEGEAGEELLVQQLGPETAASVPSKVLDQKPGLQDFCEPGVRRALFIGATLQFLQQAVGINAVLYFTPIILSDAGVGSFLQSTLNLPPTSSSLLGSGLSYIPMVPCILQAMHLMDRLGRRPLLLISLPALTIALITLAIAISLLPPGGVQATLGFLGVVIYICAFFVGMGPVPNVFCSEIFPTRISGICIGICFAAQRLASIIVSQSFPVLRVSIGSGSAFAMFAVICVVGCSFVYKYVPETKGMTLEAIYSSFAEAARGSSRELHTELLS